MVEAIETLFVPVLVHNNKQGTDAELLKRFSEPAWNNPVVRYLDAEGKDVIPRADGVWRIDNTAARMVAALSVTEQQVPHYLSQLASHSEMKIETATFAMHCYWEGEARLGSLNGVRSTRAAWRDGLEVVTAEFDAGIVDYADLLAAAQEQKCATKVFAHSLAQLKIAKRVVGGDAVLATKEQGARDANDSDQKYYLRHTPLIHVPMTEYQQTKINAALKAKTSWDIWLSQRQIRMVKQIIASKNSDPLAFDDWICPAENSDFSEYWEKLTARLHELEAQPGRSGERADN